MVTSVWSSLGAAHSEVLVYSGTLIKWAFPVSQAQADTGSGTDRVNMLCRQQVVQCIGSCEEKVQVLLCIKDSHCLLLKAQHQQHTTEDPGCVCV